MFKAIQDLPAHRRWCLTGTPIQNRLEDLGSLVAFLRLTELARISTFRTYVIAPTLTDRFTNLQTVLRTICLRRTREILGLPRPITLPRLIKFSDEERRQYTDLYEHYKRQVQMAVSGNGKFASTTLQSIHKLRIFCNNGPRGTQDELIESDDEMLSYLVQLGENVCAKCTNGVLSIDKVEGRDRAGHSPPDFATHIETQRPSSGMSEASLPYPSKLLALLDDIKGAPRNKCIVFSAWKKTLDLTAKLFNEAGLKNDMIYGSLSLKQRLKALKDFKSAFGPNILLMTLGTGAEGFVHILEGEHQALTCSGST
ncbi:hypothetical protein CUC08_Gglean002989 [Alternaria sp. MG1]|nr:hypothetical protein CUC08_Gglean002989 [Alternaria sp. MG1]